MFPTLGFDPDTMAVVLCLMVVGIIALPVLLWKIFRR